MKMHAAPDVFGNPNSMSMYFVTQNVASGKYVRYHGPFVPLLDVEILASQRAFSECKLDSAGLTVHTTDLTCQGASNLVQTGMMGMIKAVASNLQLNRLFELEEVYVRVDVLAG